MLERSLPFSPLLGQASTSNAAIYSFVIYMLGVMLLAWLSNRLLQSKSFLSEYFLGSRSLGVWAFALTFAATSSSGGSFIGFPSLVYTHGWIMALWIGSYMVVPILTMGLLGKRLNQVARKSGAITIPDVLRNRFESVSLGVLSTVLLVFFMTFNLIAQFKGGSVILQTLLADVPLFADARSWMNRAMVGVPLFGRADDGGYVICLLVFAVAVVAYTAYGGFRAVVWTDVMQGLVMVVGVVIMLPLAIMAVGGLQQATRELAQLTPPRFVTVELASKEPVTQEIDIHKNSCFLVASDAESVKLVRISTSVTIPLGEQRASFLEEEKLSYRVPGIETALPSVSQIQEVSLPVEIVLRDIQPDTKHGGETGSEKYLYGAGRPGVYATGPGPAVDKSTGYLPLSLAISFFFMWTFSGAGQPGNMIRLMAFKDSRTLRRAIFTVAIYYSLIYFPLVVIFVCARVLLPGWETESDRIMPEMTKALTLAIKMPWLGGLLVAAPFAAVMSTMDSFLLMISSALVRDVYQQAINPHASEKTIKRLTYVITVAVGVGAMLAAVSPPQFLQSIIVFTGSGLSTSFLAPVALGMYWPRCNRFGAIAGMLVGFLTHMILYLAGYFLYGKMQPYHLLGFHPFLVGMIFSLIAAIAVTLVTSPPPQHLVRRYFYVRLGSSRQ